MRKENRNTRWPEVRKLLDEGKTIREVARIMDMSVQNIYNYIKNKNYENRK